MAKLAPSILAADFANLSRDVKAVLAAGADMVHIDVMDGHFVPNLSIGVPVVKSLRAAVDGFLDVHLMITEPGRYIDAFAAAGADLINFHLEAVGDTAALLRHIRALGRRAALTLKPKTPAEALRPYLHLCDMVLIMSVEPGFGGQAFMPESLDKARWLRSELRARGLQCEIQIDGGITLENAPLATAAGVDILVAGSAVFGASDVAAAVRAFKAL